jgi:Flp pilus assembly protein TadD
VNEPNLDQAEALLAEGRAAEALLAAEIGLARRAGEAALLSLRDRAMAAIAAMEPTFAALQLDAAVNPQKLQAHLELGHAYVALERWPDAERCFKQALALDSASVEAHASLGRVYLNAASPQAAEHHSRQALALDDAHVVASQTLAALLDARGEAEAARRQLERAYSRQALFVQEVADPILRVLVLATTSAGNVPYRTIMPTTRYSRLVWYMEHARPEETPDPDRYDVVFNTIGDADLAGPSLASVERFLAGCPRAVLNRPDRVMRTRRDRTPGLLAGIPDVVAPRTVRLSAADIAASGLPALAEANGFSGPLLTRPAGLHGGQGMAVAPDPGGLAAVPVQPGDHYLIDFVDYRSTDGLFRKYRMLFIDRRPYVYHQAISDHWLVHHDTAGMTGRPERREEEARFLEAPERALGERGMAAIQRIGQALDLDYCGVDFSVLPDGRVVVFEANATMLAHLENPTGPYAYKNGYVQMIADAFQRMLKARAG